MHWKSWCGYQITWNEKKALTIHLFYSWIQYKCVRKLQKCISWSGVKGPWSHPTLRIELLAEIVMVCRLGGKKVQDKNHFKNKKNYQRWNEFTQNFHMFNFFLLNFFTLIMKILQIIFIFNPPYFEYILNSPRGWQLWSLWEERAPRLSWRARDKRLCLEKPVRTKYIPT